MILMVQLLQDEQLKVPCAQNFCNSEQVGGSGQADLLWPLGQLPLRCVI